MPISDGKYKRLTPKNVSRAPREKGVYALYADRTLVFLGQTAGKTATIRTMLETHLRGARAAAGRRGEAKAKVTMRYKREPSAQPEARLKALLNEYTAEHGRLPADNAASS